MNQGTADFFFPSLYTFVRQDMHGVESYKQLHPLSSDLLRAIFVQNTALLNRVGTFNVSARGDGGGKQRPVVFSISLDLVGERCVRGTHARVDESAVFQCPRIITIIDPNRGDATLNGVTGVGYGGVS